MLISTLREITLLYRIFVSEFPWLTPRRTMYLFRKVPQPDKVRNLIGDYGS